MATRSVNTCKTTAIQMYDYKNKVFRNKIAPGLGRLQQQSSKEDAPSTSITAAVPPEADMEKCRTISGETHDDGSSLHWYHCPPMGIDHPCFKLGLLIAATVIVVLLYLLVRVLFKWLN